MIIYVILAIIFVTVMYNVIFSICNKFHREHTVFNKIVQKSWMKKNEFEYSTENENEKILIEKSDFKDGWQIKYQFYIKGVLKYQTTEYNLISFFDKDDDFNSLKKMVKKINKSMEFNHIENLDFLR